MSIWPKDATSRRHWHCWANIWGSCSVCDCRRSWHHFDVLSGSSGCCYRLCYFFSNLLWSLHRRWIVSTLRILSPASCQCLSLQGVWLRLHFLCDGCFGHLHIGSGCRECRIRITLSTLIYVHFVNGLLLHFLQKVLLKLWF